MTTLEEVFLTVGNENFEKINAQIKGKEDTGHYKDESVSEFKNQEESDLYLGMDSEANLISASEGKGGLHSRKSKAKQGDTDLPSIKEDEEETLKGGKDDDYTIAEE